MLDHRPKVAANVGSSSVLLLCQVQAYPRPNFEWSLRDVPIIGSSDSKYEMNVTSITSNGNDIYQGILRINDVKESDYGDYTCKMWNAEGENAAAVRLQATSAPEKPTNLRAVQSGYDSLTLEWDEGFNGGSEYTIYTLLYLSTSGANTIPHEYDCQYANPCVLRNLEQLQSYTIQVRAENTKGKSPLSNTLTASTIVDLSRIPEPKHVTFDSKTKTISFDVDSQLPLMAIVESSVNGDWTLAQKISVRSPVSREVLDEVKNDVDDVRIKLCLEMNTTLCSEPIVAVTGDLIQEPTKALTDLPAKYMVAIIVACVVGSLVFVLFAVFYCYRRRRAQKLKKLLEMEKAHSARPTITTQQQQQPPPPYYAGLENKGRDASLMDTSHGSMLDDAASKNALYATQNGYGYAVGVANGHANGGDWVNMAYTEHSYSNSNNGGSVNSQDSLWQLKLAQNGGGGVNGNDHAGGGGTLPDRSYHYDPMTHGGYGGFEDYSHYPPSNGDDYLNQQRNNYAVASNGDPYAAVHKNGKRMDHLGMFFTTFFSFFGSLLIFSIFNRIDLSQCERVTRSLHGGRAGGGEAAVPPTTAGPAAAANGAASAHFPLVRRVARERLLYTQFAESQGHPRNHRLDSHFFHNFLQAKLFEIIPPTTTSFAVCQNALKKKRKILSQRQSHLNGGNKDL